MSERTKNQSIRTRFPAPWSIEKTRSGYWVVAANGRNVASVLEEEEPLRREILNYPTPSEARSIAKAISALPDLMTNKEGTE